MNLTKERFDKITDIVTNKYLTNTTKELVLNKQDKLFIVEQMKEFQDDNDVIDKSLEHFTKIKKETNIKKVIIKSKPFLLHHRQFKLNSIVFQVPEDYKDYFIVLSIPEIKYTEILPVDVGINKLLLETMTFQTSSDNLNVQLLTADNEELDSHFNLILEYQN